MDKRPNLPSNQAIFRHWQPILANMDVCIDEGGMLCLRLEWILGAGAYRAQV